MDQGRFLPTTALVGVHTIASGFASGEQAASSRTLQRLARMQNAIGENR
jgi:hypothetical protein